MTKCEIICLRISKFEFGNSRRNVRISDSCPISVYCLARLAILAIESDGKIGGKRLRKKSFNAVATALTGMSRSAIFISGSRITIRKKNYIQHDDIKEYQKKL